MDQQFATVTVGTSECLTDVNVSIEMHLRIASGKPEFQITRTCVAHLDGQWSRSHVALYVKRCDLVLISIGTLLNLH